MAATSTFGRSAAALVPRGFGRRSAPVPVTALPLVEYDRRLRRLWVAGQRLHHGATGTALAWAGATGLLARRSGSRMALLLAGGVLMAHDWKDRSVWFERGRQSQPPPR